VARNQSSTVLKFVGACAAVIVGGVAFGLLFGSVRDPHPSVQPAPTPVSTTLTPPPSIVPSSIHPRTTNGDYTAPGAPHIVIEEERQPIIHRMTPPPTPPPDPEATQEAAPLPPKPSPDETAPSDTTQTTPSNSGTTPPSTPETNSGGSPSPAAPAPASPPAAPPDSDFEHVNPPKPTPGTTDPESGQQGGSSGSAQNDSSKVQFRVQTGAYTDESNARSVADTLRDQGYSTSTRSERDGDHLVYKVQVGAYRSKNGADKAAGDLQKKGYPAFISPIGP
jgi:cell division protein FtsN